MAEAERVYRVALFGVIGTGKSSIINLLANEQVADISTNVEPCTRRARWYPIAVGERRFRLWDTMGFNPVEEKEINQLSPYEQAHAVLRNLPQGIDLILLCARIGQIGASLRKLHWLLNSFFFGGRAQIALILTHLDTIPEEQQSGWWDRNMNGITEKSGIPVQFTPHACITTICDELPHSNTLYQQSRRALEALLKEVVGTSPTPFPRDFLSASALESLKDYCQLSIGDATRLIEKFKSPARPFNAVLFGETGAGKSSVINLLHGRLVAEVSLGMHGCTLDFSRYDIDAGSHRLRVWDTVGLNGLCIGPNMYWKAMENAVRLIHSLHDEGGVDLLVFCKKAGRFTSPELNSFRLFYEFLCERQTPVSFIITHLETVHPMERWWEENGRALTEACEVKPSAIAGHACITSLLPDDSNSSRRSVQTMLEDAISYGDAFIKDPESWRVGFLRQLNRIFGVGKLLKKVAIKKLMERCGLSKEHAEELVRLLSE